MRPSIAATLTLVSLATGQQVGDGCKDVHVFLARGNNEPYPGRQGKLITAICSGLDSCDYEDIQFYNPVESPYCDSVMEGAKNGNSQIVAYNEKCPDSMLVVSGYSQGGHVVGDVLGGGGGVFFQDCVQNPNPALDPESPAGSKIVAALIFGDTRHTAGQPYNVLNGTNNDGLFPRPGDQLANLSKYTGRLHNYCVNTDPICAQGDFVNTHLNYFDVFTDEAAEWVHQQVAEASGGTSSSSTWSTQRTSTQTSRGTSSTSTQGSSATTTSESESESSTSPSTRATTSAETEESTEIPTATDLITLVGSATQATESAVAPSSTGNAAASLTNQASVVGITALLAVLGISWI